MWKWRELGVNGRGVNRVDEVENGRSGFAVGSLVGCLCVAGLCVVSVFVVVWWCGVISGGGVVVVAALLFVVEVLVFVVFAVSVTSVVCAVLVLVCAVLMLLVLGRTCECGGAHLPRECGEHSAVGVNGV